MKTIQIQLFTIPQAACASGKMTWSDAALMLKNNLERVYPGQVTFSHIEFMSPEWFADNNAQALLESGQVAFPFILVNGQIACSEPKVNISKVRRHIQSLHAQ